jgi:hypothetical protein
MSSSINASTASGGGVITTADASGILQLQTGGTTALTIDASQNVTFAKSILTSSTAQASTSGTSIDFTGIPSWAKRITVMFNGVSTNGTSLVQVQIGAGSVTTTGYVSATSVNATSTSSTTGFLTTANNGVADTRIGVMTITNISGFIWVMGASIGSNFPNCSTSAGVVTLSSTLDRVRITTVNGTDTFDAGSINIMYE